MSYCFVHKEYFKRLYTHMKFAISYATLISYEYFGIYFTALRDGYIKKIGGNRASYNVV